MMCEHFGKFGIVELEELLIKMWVKPFVMSHKFSFLAQIEKINYEKEPSIPTTWKPTQNQKEIKKECPSKA